MKINVWQIYVNIYMHLGNQSNRQSNWQSNSHISRAYFNANTSDDDPTYVALPREMGDHPGMCGLLRRHMYGTRRAADGWQEEYSSKMINAGFIQGMASPCVFHHPTRNIVCSVHGDDFTAAGPKPELDWFEAILKE